MSAEGAQHREGQLPSQPQTVCSPPLREALQGPPFPDQQAHEQLLPCGCHPVELCTTVIAPPGYPLTLLPTVTVFPPLPWPDCHTPTFSHCTFALNCSLYISIYLKLLSISIFIVFISYHISYLIYNFITSTATFTCTSPALYIYLYHICTNHHYCCSCSYCSYHISYIILDISYLSIFILPSCTYSALFCFALLVRC